MQKIKENLQKIEATMHRKESYYFNKNTCYLGSFF